MREWLSHCWNNILTIILAITVFLGSFIEKSWDLLNQYIKYHFSDSTATIIGGIISGVITFGAMLFIYYLQKKESCELEQRLSKKWRSNAYIKAYTEFVLSAYKYYSIINHDFKFYIEYLISDNFTAKTKNNKNFNEALKESIKVITDFRRITPIWQKFEEHLLKNNNLNVDTNLVNRLDVFYEQIYKAIEKITENNGDISYNLNQDGYKNAVRTLIRDYTNLDLSDSRKNEISEMGIELGENAQAKNSRNQFVLNEEYSLNTHNINSFYKLIIDDLENICRIYTKEIEEGLKEIAE